MAKKLKVDDVPDGFNYAAVNADGFAFAYKYEPYSVKIDEVWKSRYSEDSIRMIGGGFDPSNWANSLVSRGTAEQAEPKKLTAADIPDGYGYAAVDADGFAYAFKDRPQLNKDDGYWCFALWDDALKLGNGYDSTDWQNSLVCREPEQKPKLKKLTAADIPQGYKYAAVDADGKTYAYVLKPTLQKSGWCSLTGKYFFLTSQYDASDWEKSLVSREVEQKPVLKKLTAADIPDGYNFAAVNANGGGYAFKARPILFNSFWAEMKNCEIGGVEFLEWFDATDWQNSLVSRESQEINKNPLLSVSEFMQVVKEIQDYKNLPIETEPAYKETNNKLSYSEIDPYFLEAMARRMNEGKRKYGPNNWKKLSDINELLDAAQRHLLELRKMMEEDFEAIPGQETDLQHCAALACNAMFIHYHLNPNT